MAQRDIKNNKKEYALETIERFSCIVAFEIFAHKFLQYLVNIVLIITHPKLMRLTLASFRYVVFFVSNINLLEVNSINLVNNVI